MPNKLSIIKFQAEAIGYLDSMRYLSVTSGILFSVMSREPLDSVNALHRAL